MTEFEIDRIDWSKVKTRELTFTYTLEEVLAPIKKLDINWDAVVHQMENDIINDIIVLSKLSK